MTLFGVGLGPGDAGLVTVRGRELLESADVVYSPGRLSRSVATEYVPGDRIGDLDFPMTRDGEKLRRAWKDAAADVAPRARDGTAAFVTLGDPNVYSTFGHLRRTLAAFHPDVEVTVVPGVSAVTAFAAALDVEIAAGGSIALREASGGAAPTGPDRMVLFKVTDVPATHAGLAEAGYDVVYGRRLYMQHGETVVTDDPDELQDRDYYTLAYAEQPGAGQERATDAFEPAGRATTDGGVSAGDVSARTPADAAFDRSGALLPPIGDTDRPRAPLPRGGSRERSGSNRAESVASRERSEAQLSGDEVPR